MAHDFDQQRRDTLWVWNDIASRNPDLSAKFILDLHFIPANEMADWDAFERSLRIDGYSTNRYDDGSTLEVKTGPLELNADVIWQHEKRTTEIALSYGFNPDGWGFLHDKS